MSRTNLQAAHPIQAVEPVTRPLLPVRNSLDDLFSDAESDQDGKDVHHTENEYDPNAPTKSYEEVDAQREFGSPQISPGTPFHPHQQPSLKKVQREEHFEVQSTLSEDDQIAHFADKAFRNVLRECEPGLSKEQQYYAWRIAYQNAYGEQADGTADHKEFGGRLEIPDQNMNITISYSYSYYCFNFFFELQRRKGGHYTTLRT